MSTGALCLRLLTWDPRHKKDQAGPDSATIPKKAETHTEHTQKLLNVPW